jgi:hypothetical protein
MLGRIDTTTRSIELNTAQAKVFNEGLRSDDFQLRYRHNEGKVPCMALP